MSFPNDIAGILDVLVALFQSSLRVVVMAKSVRHPGITLHSHIVTSCFKQVTIFVRLVSAEIEFRRDDVCSRHAFEGFCEDG